MRYETAGFPAALVAVSGIGFPYDDDESVDYEPYPGFMPEDENASWFPMWIGNQAEDGRQFRVFGQDGSGGYAAFWLVREGAAIEQQPVVFFGSEGAIGVVARDLGRYLWLLADGWGPFEAVEYGQWTTRPRPELIAIAEQFAPQARLGAAEVVAEALAEFPGFTAYIEGLCR